MVIGCIGAVPFYVSSEAVKTFETFQLSSSARYATHQLAYGNTLLEFTGTDPSQVQIEILLSAYLGVSPATEYRQLETYELNGIAVPVVMGDYAYGRWRWGYNWPDLQAGTLRQVWQRDQRQGERDAERIHVEVMT